MSRSKSSKRWLQEHFSDPFVQQSQKQGLRSRAAYKLMEIQQKDRLIQPGMVVADLGAAPGGWSQLASSCLKGKGKLFALDILPMEPLADVEFIQGDFRQQSVLESLFYALNGELIDLVMSDMAPNLSGAKNIDQPRIMYLCELALDFARQVLKLNGVLLVKSFHGQGFEAYVKDLRTSFSKVLVRKPKASRDRSPECYLLAIGFDNNQGDSTNC